MFTLRGISRSILSFLVLTALVTTAMSGESPKPSGKVTMESKSIAAGIGITWGDGKLNFKGKDYPFSIDGLTLVDFGISKASATGDVYNLTDSAKLAGTYVAAEAGITLAELADSLVRTEAISFRQAHDVASKLARGMIELVWTNASGTCRCPISNPVHALRSCTNRPAWMNRSFSAA